MKEDEVARSKLSENTTNTKSPVEANINEIAETLVRLHVLNYLDVDEEGEKRIVEAAVSELQSIATNLQTRWKKVNYVNFLTQTVVIQLTKHFEAQQVYFSNQDKNCSFVTFSHLQSEESEEVYVRRLAVLMVRFLLPAQYQRTSLSRTLAEDILTNLIILPIINKITDPHFINQQCIAILKEENIERLSSESSPGITADKTEDDLLSLKHCEDREGEGETWQSPSVFSLLKQNMELMDSESQSLDTDCLPHTGEAETASCQLRLDDSFVDNSENISLDSILRSPSRRKYLSDFLDLHGSAPLLSLWEEIEDLKCCENHLIHHVGTQIFSTYLSSPSAPGLTLDKDLVARLETFLTGGDHQVFFEIQSEISENIKNNFFTDFCRSHFYLDMTAHSQSACGATYQNVWETKLGAIDDQIETKIEAQKLLMASLEPESEILEAISEEIAELRALRSELALHGQQTDFWTENLGLWRSRVVALTQTDKVETDNLYYYSNVRIL